MDPALKYLFSLGNEILAMKLGLDAIGRLLEALGNPHSSFPSILVAGTNGKGSTCAMTASILRRAGKTVGLYTSPHLVRIEERIRIDGEMISGVEFCALIDELRATVDGLLASGALPARPTFFEHVTAAAFLHFQRKKVDIAVLEVGLGGRLDATNIVTPVVAAIASIGHDHQEYLGNTLWDIAGEKAAIIKPGARAFIAQGQPEEAAERLHAHITEVGAVADWVDPFPILDRGEDGRLRVSVTGKVVELPFRGDYQAQNAATAAAIARYVLRDADHLEQTIVTGLENARWPGRLEWIASTPPILLDGAHNPEGAQTLAAYLSTLKRAPRTLIFAAMRDKPAAELLEPLAPHVETIICVPVRKNKRTTAPEELARVAANFWPSDRIRVESTFLAGLQSARALTPGGGAIVVGGSLYLVGEARQVLCE